MWKLLVYLFFLSVFSCYLFAEERELALAERMPKSFLEYNDLEVAGMKRDERDLLIGFYREVGREGKWGVGYRFQEPDSHRERHEQDGHGVLFNFLFRF